MYIAICVLCGRRSAGCADNGYGVELPEGWLRLVGAELSAVHRRSFPFCPDCAVKLKGAVPPPAVEEKYTPSREKMKIEPSPWHVHLGAEHRGKP